MTLTQKVPLWKINAYNVARPLLDECLFKYGALGTVITDNGSDFASEFFRMVCVGMGIGNYFTSNYHPQTNGQNRAVEPDNFSDSSLLCGRSPKVLG